MKFKVGDKVICFERDIPELNGKLGTITTCGEGSGWPVFVKFQGLDSLLWSYNEDGFRMSENPTFNRIEPATKLHRLLAGLE